jgi:hypothetical protein
MTFKNSLPSSHETPASPLQNQPLSAACQSNRFTVNNMKRINTQNVKLFIVKASGTVI